MIQIVGVVNAHFNNIYIWSKNGDDMSKYGEYGSGSKIEDWEHYNPHHLKLNKIPEEKMCGLCDSVADTIFPIVGMVLCFDCANEVKERDDIFLQLKPYMRVSKATFCGRCGRTVNWGAAATTRICHKCTVRAGKFETNFNKPKYGRRVV